MALRELVRDRKRSAHGFDSHKVNLLRVRLRHDVEVRERLAAILVNCPKQLESRGVRTSSACNSGIGRRHGADGLHEEEDADPVRIGPTSRKPIVVTHGLH